MFDRADMECDCCGVETRCYLIPLPHLVAWKTAVCWDCAREIHWAFDEIGEESELMDDNTATLLALALMFAAVCWIAWLNSR